MLDTPSRQTDNSLEPAQGPATLPITEPVRIDLTSTESAQAATDSASAPMYSVPDRECSEREDSHALSRDLPAVNPARVDVCVWAIVPCYNRAADLKLLLSDVTRLELGCGIRGEQPRDVVIQLKLIVIDNASDTPLSAADAPATLDVEYLRLPENTGGSGGFNAGLQRVMSLVDMVMTDPGATGAEYFLWLLDSDARVLPGTLRELVRVLLNRRDAAAVGSAIAEPETGRVFEIGGSIDRHNGRFKSKATGRAGIRGPISCDYVAACSALVRVDAARKAGLFPDVFLNADDVEWFIRLSRLTGQAILASPDSIAVHPSFDRFATTARYYVARNCLGPLRELGLPKNVRFRRALHEVRRAVVQELNLRPKLAKMHLAGLADASKPIVPGKAATDVTSFESFQPVHKLAQRLVNSSPKTLARISVQQTLLDELSDADREALIAEVAVVLAQSPGIDMTIDHARGNGRKSLALACKRLLLGPREQIAIVSARTGCMAWFAGQTIVQVAPGAGYLVRTATPIARWRAAWRGVRTLFTGLMRASRAAGYTGERPVSSRDERRGPEPTVFSSEATPASADKARASDRTASPTKLSLAIIVLSYNRRETLRRTLERLARLPECARASIIVVDNASTDGSAKMVATDFRSVTLLALTSNIGVAALNAGVDAALSDVVLVLDDDAWPEPGVVAEAMDVLERRSELAAVALHPVHPETRASEWPFAASLAGGTDDRWPVMGCGNLVRRSAWIGAQGYDPLYFLYRNDTDLALKLLGTRRIGQPAGDAVPVRGIREEATEYYGVHFDPRWIVWHESHAASSKSVMWHRLATRNWIWMARRHGRGANRVLGITLGVLWSHKLAGLRLGCHWATVSGVAAGFVTRPPSLTPSVAPTGRDYTRLLRLHLSRLRKRR